MATYAIGDIQGCFAELGDLLELIDWKPPRDRLWLVGDLVNRGPRSREVLRFAKQYSNDVDCVLGNHDLHLLATFVGEREPKPADTFMDVLQSGDCGELLGWLRSQPLIHHDAPLNFVMVHAGLPAEWGLDDALAHGEVLSRALRAEDYGDFFAHMYGDQPTKWTENLRGWDRLRFITNAFTRMRFCDGEGALVMGPAGPPEQEKPERVPWYAIANRKTKSTRVVFGHWAALPQSTTLAREHNVFHIDSGCVWGGGLTALRLDDLNRFTVPSRPV